MGKTSSGGSTPTKPKATIASIYDLINSSVDITTGTGKTAQTVTMPSPLNDPGARASDGPGGYRG